MSLGDRILGPPLRKTHEWADTAQKKGAATPGTEGPVEEVASVLGSLGGGALGGAVLATTAVVATVVDHLDLRRSVPPLGAVGEHVDALSDEILGEVGADPLSVDHDGDDEEDGGQKASGWRRIPPLYAAAGAGFSSMFAFQMAPEFREMPVTSQAVEIAQWIGRAASSYTTQYAGVSLEDMAMSVQVWLTQQVQSGNSGSEVFAWAKDALQHVSPTDFLTGALLCVGYSLGRAAIDYGWRGAEYGSLIGSYWVGRAGSALEGSRRPS